MSYGHMIMEGYNYIDSFGKGLISNFHRAIRLKEVSNFDAIQLIDPINISVEEINKAYAKGCNVYERLTNLSPNILLEGVTNYVESNWTQSLILVWTNIEQLLNQIWEENIIADVSNKRKDFLNDFRTWTAAAKIEVLFIKGYLLPDIYDLINKVRKVRNEFMHKTEQIKKESVDDALNVLFSLISLIDSEYKDKNTFDGVVEMIIKQQRGFLFHNMEECVDVKYWRMMPPLPGSKAWGDKPFEIVEELRLQELSVGNNKKSL